MSTKDPARAKAAGAVHTSALPDFAPPGANAAAPGSDCTGCGGCAGGCADKPALHKPSAPQARDQYTGIAGRFVRDPVTGERKRVATQG